ncbi:MAG: ATP phosphoribosyltransferase regulatory subunit [bacterium]
MSGQIFESKPYKGTRDFYPEDLKKRSYIFNTWKKVLLENSYSEYDSSILENAELYIAKSGDELGSKQLYSFEDKGERKVALRPEMTPSLARIVANKFGELKFPLRWFSIPNCFRYEKPQRGRTREFWQLNLDLIGLEAGASDLEMLIILGKIFLSFGAKKEMYSIRYGHRGLIDEQVKIMGLENQSKLVYEILDNWKKMRASDRLAFAKEEGMSEDQYLLIQNYVDNPTVDFEKFPELALIKNLTAKILPEVDYLFDPTIVRGLAYYTGLVFEAFDNNPENNRALFGGGRYDNLMELFGKHSPAVGAAIGDLPWHEFLEGWNLYPDFSAQRDKVGIMPILENATQEEILEKIYTQIIPDIQAKNQDFEIDYDFARNPNKRYESLKKRGCGEVMEVK